MIGNENNIIKTKKTKTGGRAQTEIATKRIKLIIPCEWSTPS